MHLVKPSLIPDLLLFSYEKYGLGYSPATDILFLLGRGDNGCRRSCSTSQTSKIATPCSAGCNDRLNCYLFLHTGKRRED